MATGRGGKRLLARVLMGTVLSLLVTRQLQEASRMTNQLYRAILDDESQTPPLMLVNNESIGVQTIRGNVLETVTSSSGQYSRLPQQPFNSSEGIAVCFAFSDDNMILSEWIAYHFTTLPLRNLLVLQDPKSRTSPREILDRWNQSNLDIQVWLWRDEDFMRKSDLRRFKEMAKIGTSKADHDRLLKRQNAFAVACNKFFKKLENDRKITWVGHFDVDEFVVPNRVAHWETKLAKKKLRQRATHLNNDRLYLDAIEMRSQMFRTLERTKQRSNSSSFLTALEVLNATRDFYTTPNCIPMGRWNHGTRPLGGHSVETWNSSIGIINTSRLETLQYLRGDHPVLVKRKIRGKMMVDLSQLSMENLTKSVSPHRPLPSPFCEEADVTYLESFLSLNHYRGSWERYSFRNDSRRTYDLWQEQDKRYRKMDSAHYQIYKWMPRFVELVGSEERAAYLLGHQDAAQYYSE